LLLTTTKREVVLSYYEKRTLDYARFEIELLHYLTQFSYPCAAPLATQQGTYIGTYENKPFALFELVPGEHSDNQENYLQVAEAIGQLHTLTIHYRPSDGLTRPTYNQAYSWSWAQKSAERIKSEAPEALECHRQDRAEGQ
jgi:homoserine kinase type II